MLEEEAICRVRLKAAHALLCKAILVLAECCPSWFDDLWMTDATPLPCGASRETAQRPDLAGHDGSHGASETLTARRARSLVVGCIRK